MNTLTNFARSPHLYTARDERQAKFFPPSNVDLHFDCFDECECFFVVWHETFIVTRSREFAYIKTIFLHFLLLCVLYIFLFVYILLRKCTRDVRVLRKEDIIRGVGLSALVKSIFVLMTRGRGGVGVSKAQEGLARVSNKFQMTAILLTYILSRNVSRVHLMLRALGDDSPLRCVCAARVILYLRANSINAMIHPIGRTRGTRTHRVCVSVKVPFS